MSQPKRVVVIIGSGGMGIACARRLAPGRTVVLADYSKEYLDKALNTLSNDGYSPIPITCDVSSSTSVQALAKEATSHGRLEAIVHTAGVSPVSGTAKQIFDVDLVGTANVIDAFRPHVEAGTAMVCISSMAGHFTLPHLSKELQKHFADAPASSLLSHPAIPGAADGGTAYGISKAANILRVQACARSYGEKGARINSISPGIIHTPLGKQELEGPSRQAMQSMISNSALQRHGYADEIAAAAAFLTGPDSSFITGTDILVDGTLTSSQLKHKLTMRQEVKLPLSNGHRRVPRTGAKRDRKGSDLYCHARHSSF